MTPEQENQIAQYLVANFTTTSLNALLTTRVWPELQKRRAVDQNERYKARYEAQRQARRALALERDRSTRFMDLDNTPLTNREVERRSKTGQSVKEIGTGHVMRFRLSDMPSSARKGYGRWEEIPQSINL